MGCVVGNFVGVGKEVGTPLAGTRVGARNRYSGELLFKVNGCDGVVVCRVVGNHDGKFVGKFEGLDTALDEECKCDSPEVKTD